MTDWAKLVDQKLAWQADKIPSKWRLSPELLKDVNQDSEQSAFEILNHNNLLSDKERHITENYSAGELCAELASGRLSAVDVCSAFCHRAAVAQQLVNCGTEIFFDEALERAKHLDAYMAEHGKPVGPFHGLPISVKDSFNVAGKQTTVGMVSYLSHDVAISNAPLLDTLLELGGVLYIKTNVPQTLLALDSVNNVFGRTLNPHCLSLTAGGSSGGEGALVGFHGSPLGVGTDLGGSIRVPALCGGIFGFKPTANRLPYGGQKWPLRDGSPGMASSAGPLCYTAADLTFFTREVIMAKPWTRDSTAFHINWRQIQPRTGLKIGLYLGHPECPLTAPVRQALETSAAALRQAGHQIIPVDDLPSPLTAARIALGYLALDNNQTPLREIEAGGEKPIKALEYMGITNNVEGLRLGDLPQTFRDAIHFALRVDHRVHYIWIDSLCIIQGDEEDWLKESDLMQDVYRNSFLNISATAAEHSGEGLYSHRDPQHLWEEIVRLDVGGLHQAAETIRQKSSIITRSNHNRDAETTDTRGSALNSKYTPLSKVQGCLLVDVSDWERLVNQAPVNNRGWVVQERLLAPRVLYFCRGRVAWECGEFDDIEGHVPDTPNYQLIAGEIYERVPIKGLKSGEHGRSLGNNRFRGGVNSLDLAENDPKSRIVHSLELWFRIVEMYCKTNLTQQKDKLIALSGIAHSMANIIAESGQIQYVAGLWNVHLISQLLWHVEPVYRGDSDSSSDIFEYPAKRPIEYRAPSFSWASVDAQFGKGVSCGHIIDSESDILVEVQQDAETDVWKKSVSVKFETKNKFGLVRNSHIRLWAWVHHVKLGRDGTQYYWSLLDGNDSINEPEKRDKDMNNNFNVHLDCPSDDDKGNRLINSDETYCVPMAYGPSSSSNDIICLLLERVNLSGKDTPMGKAGNVDQILEWPADYQEETFRRIGYTKVSATFDHFTWEYISNHQTDQKVSDAFYNEKSGRHLVCII